MLTGGGTAGPCLVAAALTAMAAKLAYAGLGALMLAATAAQASEATTVADRAGFLIGHAQRCGVAEDRLVRSAGRVDTIIAAFSLDDGDREAAQARFAESIAAAALAQLLGDKLPSCGIVRSTLVQFERHRQPAEQRERQMARNDHRDGGTARRAATGATPSKAARRSSTKREDLSAERRAALESQRAAQQTRGKPPSI